MLDENTLFRYEESGGGFDGERGHVDSLGARERERRRESGVRTRCPGRTEERGERGRREEKGREGGREREEGVREQGEV